MYLNSKWVSVVEKWKKLSLEGRHKDETVCVLDKMAYAYTCIHNVLLKEKLLPWRFLYRRTTGSHAWQ